MTGPTHDDPGNALPVPQEPKVDSKSKQRPLWLNVTLFSAAVAAAVCTYLFLPEDLPVPEGFVSDQPARLMAAIFALALVLWVTEAIPLFATSLLVIMCEAWLIATAGETLDARYTIVLAAFSSPIIWIFLGGFILAKGIQREGLDVQMAAIMLRPFGSRPAMMMAGMMLITALFSMFMSNTATTAMMIILVAPILKQLSTADPFRKGIVLAIPFAANIGGVGTPIGTPPNAVAIGQLEKTQGIAIGFAEWMAVGVPLVLGTLALMWMALALLFRSEKKALHVALPQGFKLTRNAVIVYATFALTVALWLTGTFTGLPTAVVAVVPAALLTMTRIIGRSEFNSLEWDILMLIAGGIALGTGITSTGLDQWIVGVLPGDDVSMFVLVLAFCVLGVTLSTVMSNSVAANLLIPIALVVVAARPDVDNIDIAVLAIVTAVTTSFAMGLPISTPPNAIAYGSGEIGSRDMLLVGGICSVLATLFIVLTGPFTVGLILGLFGR